MHVDDRYEQQRRPLVRKHVHSWTRIGDPYAMQHDMDVTWIQPGPGNHTGDDIVARCECGAVVRRDSLANYNAMFNPPGVPKEVCEGKPWKVEVTRAESWK